MPGVFWFDARYFSLLDAGYFALLKIFLSFLCSWRQWRFLGTVWWFCVVILSFVGIYFRANFVSLVTQNTQCSIQAPRYHTLADENRNYSGPLCDLQLLFHLSLQASGRFFLIYMLFLFSIKLLILR